MLNSNQDMERCVICDAVTDVPTTQPISERHDYVIGAGQLCPTCYRNAYPPKHPLVNVVAPDALYM